MAYFFRFFKGVAAKLLSAVEVDPSRSNQHEFNGVQGLHRLLGTEEFRGRKVRFVRMEDGAEERPPDSEDVRVSWYDSRARNPKRTEWRLYYSRSVLMERAREGDLLVVARCADEEILFVVAPGDSSWARKMSWLMGLSVVRHEAFSIRSSGGEGDLPSGFAARMLLDELGALLGIEEASPEAPEDEDLDALVASRFPRTLPKTREFSEFARVSLPGAPAPAADPDGALLAWMEREESLFRALERRLVSRRLEKGFVAPGGAADVDGFIKFSLSVQNRRKSRAGQALEHHLEAIFAAGGLRFERGARTEGNKRPDFLFPGGREHADPSFPDARLMMLGAKFSCKERWRQVLAEADRIQDKHLLTLESAISKAQLDEMRGSRLQLVVPLGVQESYGDSRGGLLSLAGFIGVARARQKGAAP